MPFGTARKTRHPDEFTFAFLKAHWVTIKPDILGFMNEFHKSGRIVKGGNSTFLSLNPKGPDPVTIAGYRPISLVGCWYKILAKLLADRLKVVMSALILKNQSAFVSGRQILDGVLIANEIINWAITSNKSLRLLQVEFAKAYDCVNWEFLDSVMEQMKFGSQWRLWIKGCLSSTKVSVLVNGSLTPEFQMERDIRQGDPLSPFLFLLVAEAVSVMIQEACSQDLFKGCRVGTTRIEVSHLQFADDSPLLGEWSSRNAVNLMLLLHNFGKASGLTINLHKSCLFGIGVSVEEINRIAARIHCSSASLPFTYLGLPVGDNMKRVASWRMVEETVKRKLSRWKQRSLSIRGRLTLIKSVINSLPLYSSLFRATATTLQSLENLRTKFFWGGCGVNRKIIWAKAARLHGALTDGRLNVGSLKSKNLALLCKWLWRFRVEESALWVQIIKAIYGVDGGLHSQLEIPLKGPWAAFIKAGLDVSKILPEFRSSFEAYSWRWECTFLA